MSGCYFAEGVYVGRVVGQELGVSSKKNTPQLVVSFEIIDALDRMGASCGVPEVKTRSVYLYLTEKAMEMALSALKVLGFTKTSLKYLDPDEAGFVDFTGKEIELYCKHEEYEGEYKERWSINTPRESKPVEKSELRKLDALFGKALKAQAAPEAQPDSDLNRAMQEAAAANADEESPF